MRCGHWHAWRQQALLALRRGEAVGNHLLHAKPGQQVAHALLVFQRRIGALRRRGVADLRFRHALIAINTRHLFHQIGDALRARANVQAMVWGGHYQRAARILNHKFQRTQDAHNLRRGNLHAQVALHFCQRQPVQWRHNGLRVHIAQFGADAATRELLHERSRAQVGQRRHGRVHAAAKAVAGL